MTFRQAISKVSDTTILKIAFPEWVWGNAETRKRRGLGGIAAKGWLGKEVQLGALAFAELQVRGFHRRAPFQIG